MLEGLSGDEYSAVGGGRKEEQGEIGRGMSKKGRKKEKVHTEQNRAVNWKLGNWKTGKLAH